MLTLCDWGGSIFTFLLLTLLLHESGQLKNSNKNKKKPWYDELWSVILSIRTAMNTPLDLKMSTTVPQEQALALSFLLHASTYGSGNTV